ncbi:hypothetical protein ACO0RG_001014 [Hanseniaspora osmophila]
MTQLTVNDFKQLYQPLLSKYDKQRKFSSFTDVGELPPELQRHKTPVWLANGQPFESLFPIQEIDLQIRENPGSLIDETPISGKYSTTKIQMYEPKGSSKLGLSDALQYSDTKGHTQLLNITKQIISRISKPKYDEWDTVITCGSSDGLSKICKMLLDEDSTLLVEEFTYPNILPWLNYAGGSIVQVKLNVTPDPSKQGIDPEAMSELLENWSDHHPNENKPKALYTIATGHNPTGLTQSLEVREKIYNICCKHNIIIIEDDPYGYLQMTPYDSKDPMANPYATGDISVDDYVSKILSPSYLTLDTEGRVLRCETFSKVAAPGLRLGFVTGNAYLISKVKTLNDISTRFASGASQAILVNMLVDMGAKYQAEHKSAPAIDGWIDWCMKIASEYTNRRNHLFKCVHEQPAFKEKKFELIEPSCGMFVTVVVNLKPEWKKTSIKRAMDYLYCLLLEEGCFAVLGYKMTVDEKFSMERSNFLRCTISKANDPKVFELGAQRLNKAVERLFSEYGVNEKFTLGKNGFKK